MTTDKQAKDGAEEGNVESGEPSIRPATVEEVSGGRNAVEAAVVGARPRAVDSGVPSHVEEEPIDAKMVSANADRGMARTGGEAEDPGDEGNAGQADSDSKGDEVDPEEHTKAELEKLAKKAGVSPSGTKSDVADRINEAKSEK